MSRCMNCGCVFEEEHQMLCSQRCADEMFGEIPPVTRLEPVPDEGLEVF